VVCSVKLTPPRVSSPLSLWVSSFPLSSRPALSEFSLEKISSFALRVALLIPREGFEGGVDSESSQPPTLQKRWSPHRSSRQLLRLSLLGTRLQLQQAAGDEGLAQQPLVQKRQWGQVLGTKIARELLNLIFPNLLIFFVDEFFPRPQRRCPHRNRSPLLAQLHEEKFWLSLSLLEKGRKIFYFGLMN
jgi:hypothetical protein